MNKQRYSLIENESVLIEAKVGIRIFSVYCFFFVLCALLGSLFLFLGIAARAHGITKSVLIIVVAAIFYATIPILGGRYVSIKNRRYILTDKRIIITKGGRLKREIRTLSLKSIQGIAKYNNFLYNSFGLATIDFYALAVASNITKIRLFSFSSTDFKFQWIDKSDADIVYDYIQNHLLIGDFPSKNKPIGE